MDKQKKKRLLQTPQEINRLTVVTGVGFLLCLAARAVGMETIAGLLSIVLTAVSAWVFVSAMELREKDRDAAGYNMIWGSGALTVLLFACAAVQIKLWFGL